MIKCKDCFRTTFRDRCFAHGKEECKCQGKEIDCDFFQERREAARIALDKEMERRLYMEWIDFEKQKPPHGDSVLGIDTDGNIEVYQYNSEYSNSLQKWEGIFRQFSITHWLPIPKPPKEDKHD